MENEQNNLPNLLAAKDVKKYLKCGNEKLYKLLKQKTFPSLRIGGKWYIIEDKFIDWMELQTKKANKICF